MTEIIVHDTVTHMADYYVQPRRPVELLDAVLEELMPGLGLPEIQKATSAQGTGGFDVLRAAYMDGVAMGQQGWGLFNPTRKREASAWVFEQFREVAILDRIRESLTALLDSLTVAESLPRLECYLFPADPANKPLMVHDHGLSCGGLLPGKILLQLWPSAGNLARLDAALARALVQTSRQTRFDSQALVTLGDWLVSEGLAACAIESLLDQPWTVTRDRPADWDAELDRIAQDYYDLPRYSEMTVNIYGQMIPVDSAAVPAVAVLDDEEAAYTQALLLDNLDERDSNRIAAFLYGDEIVARQGFPTEGVSAFAGFTLAEHLLRAYLDHSGQTVAEALLLPTETLLAQVG